MTGNDRVRTAMALWLCLCVFVCVSESEHSAPPPCKPLYSLWSKQALTEQRREERRGNIPILSPVVPISCSNNMNFGPLMQTHKGTHTLFHCVTALSDQMVWLLQSVTCQSWAKTGCNAVEKIMRASLVFWPPNRHILHPSDFYLITFISLNENLRK